MLNTLKSKIGNALSFGYDAATTGKRRKNRQVTLLGEDSVLSGSKRKKLVSDSRDLQRNFATFAWGVRKHLDFVSSFMFQANTGNPELDAVLEKFISDESKKDRFDRAGRRSLKAFVRTFESRALIEGDCGVVLLKSGHVQAIESDRIRNPDKEGRSTNWVNGVKVDNFDRALSYSVRNRSKTGAGYESPRNIPAKNFYLHCYSDRFDQIRGVSPWSAGINTMLDVYEGVDYSLAKLKVEQLFAMTIYRDSTSDLGYEAPVDEDEEASEDSYDFDPTKGPSLLDLDPGDRAEFLQSNSPGANVKDFLLTAMMVALKSIDIPMSFFDESHTNFFGSRGAWLHYERSCETKRDNLREGFLDWWTEWKLTKAIIDGRIVLPEGMKLDSDLWEWVPKGMPWWDPVKEVRGEEMAIRAGLTTPQAVCKSRGTNYEDNIRKIAKAKEQAEELGLNMSFVVEPEKPEEPTKEKEGDDDDDK